MTFPCDLVVLVPMLGRAHLMAGVRDSLHDTTESARLLWLITHGDTEVAANVRPGEEQLRFRPRPRGDYAHKMNTGVACSHEPLLFLGACDIAFRDGWLDACRPHLDAGAGVVGTNDAGNPRTATGELSTHSLVTRKYAAQGMIDDPSQLLNDAYWHEYVDDEFVATAKHRQAYRHAPDAIVEHLHPSWGKREADSLDARQRERMRFGRRLFNTRRHLWT